MTDKKDTPPTSEDTEDTEDTNLLSLLDSWDVETFLEQTDTEETQCKYFKDKGVCPYQEVGCMFSHDLENNGSSQEPEVEDVKEEKKKQTRERLSARSRNRKINEDRFRRMRDLSISCS